MNASTLKSKTDRFAMQVAALVSDGSKVEEEDREAFVETREEILSLTQRWAKAHYSAGGFALAIGVKLAALRRFIRFGDSYDAAGNSHVYRLIVEPDIGEALSKVEVPEGVAPLDLATFKNRVKVARSENRVNFAVAAEDVVAADPELAATVVTVSEPVLSEEGDPVLNEDGTPKVQEIETTVGAIVAANPPGVTSSTPVPEVLAEAVWERVFSGQKSKDGKPLAGFAREDIPPTFGRQPKVKTTRAPKVTPVEPDTPSEPKIEPVDWAKVSATIAHTEGLATVEGLLLALTALSDALAGPAGSKKGTATGILTGAKKKAAAAYLPRLSDLAFALGAFLNEGTVENREKVQSLRWDDSTEDEDEG